MNVLALVVLPPPVNGMTLATEAMMAALQESDRCNLRVIAVSRPTWLPRRLWPLYRQLAFLSRLPHLIWARLRGFERLYYVPDGGSGQWRSLWLNIVARLVAYELIAHHHVRSYIERPSLPNRLAFAATRRQTRHVVLCDALGARLHDSFRDLAEITVLGNEFLGAASGSHLAVRSESLRGEVTTDADDRPLVVGFLGNICAAKGIDTLVEAARRIAASDGGIEVVVAGPIVESAAAHWIEAGSMDPALALEYLGPVYRDEKRAFFARIDVLVFPSRYPLEAQPLTIFEALNAGVPVIATPIGCVASQIAGNGWLVSSGDELHNLLKTMVADRTELERLRGGLGRSSFGEGWKERAVSTVVD